MNSNPSNPRSDDWIPLADGAGVVQREVASASGPDIPGSHPAEAPQREPDEAPAGSPEEHPDSRPGEQDDTPVEIPQRPDGGSIER
jgi:hypothetical protein